MRLMSLFKKVEGLLDLKAYECIGTCSIWLVIYVVILIVCLFVNEISVGNISISISISIISVVILVTMLVRWQYSLVLHVVKASLPFTLFCSHSLLHIVPSTNHSNNPHIYLVHTSSNFMKTKPYYYTIELSFHFNKTFIFNYRSYFFKD